MSEDRRAFFRGLVALGRGDGRAAAAPPEAPAPPR